MRLKLVPNYNFKTHEDASALRDNLGEFRCLFNYLLKIVRVLVGWLLFLLIVSKLLTHEERVTFYNYFVFKIDTIYKALLYRN